MTIDPPALHPLRPLAAEEVDLAGAIVRSAPAFEEPTRFVYLSLVEPAKDQVLAAEAGGPTPARRAKAVLRNPARRATVEAVVSLDDKVVESWTPLPDAQPSLTPDELIAAEEAVRADPRWQAAMRRRGVEDPARAQIDS
jgi:primary-amine oxidase